MIKTIFLLITLAFILRILFIFQGGLSFHYDMARDAFVAQQIWKEGDLKILGPPTSTPGLYHGVLYYYLIAPFYSLGQGDPKIVAVFLSLINSLTIIPIVLLTKDLLKNKLWAILAGLLFAVSFEATQYGPWLSNPAPAILTVAAFFYFLRLWQKGQSRGLYLATLMAALSTQFQFFLIYLFLLIPIFKYLFRIKTNLKEIYIASGLAFLALSSFLITAIKFNTLGLMLKGFLNISTTAQIDFRDQFTQLVLNYINKFADLFINNFLPTNVFLGGLLGFLVLYVVYQERFVLFSLLSNFLIFIFGGHSNVYANVGLILPAILGVAVLLRKLQRLNLWIFLFLIMTIFTSNIYTIFKNSPQGQITLVIPNDMILKNQLKLIDDTYQLANSQPFSINTLTLPLWTNTTWAYLYSWYGKEKFGYLPKFYGRDQIGQLGDKSLEKIDQPLEKSFFIIEPHEGIPVSFFNDEIATENSKTKLLNEISYGALKLQSRTPIKND